jgi:putative transposase
MMLTRKIRINPSSEAQAKLWAVSRVCAFIWNFTLDQRSNNPLLTVYQQKKELPKLKKEHLEFKKPSSQVLQNVIFAIDQSWKMFTTKKQRGDTKVQLPKHKLPNVFFTQEYSQGNISFKFETGEEGTVLRLAYGSRPRDWIYIPIPLDDYEQAKTVTIIYKNKKWYACVTYHIDTPPLKRDGHVLYFDPGCRVALTGIKSTGAFFEYDIKPLSKINKETYVLIDRLKAKRDAKKKDSYHYRRLASQIKELYSKIRTRSKTYLHTLAKRILEDHQDAYLFAIGDWKKQETLANTGNRNVDKKINRAVQNNLPLEKLIEYLTYKGIQRGQKVEKFDERGTTRTCCL